MKFLNVFFFHKKWNSSKNWKKHMSVLEYLELFCWQAASKSQSNIINVFVYSFIIVWRTVPYSSHFQVPQEAGQKMLNVSITLASFSFSSSLELYYNRNTFETQDFQSEHIRNSRLSIGTHWKLKTFNRNTFKTQDFLVTLTLVDYIKKDLILKWQKSEKSSKKTRIKNN